jgi:hypothetical protein
MGAWSNILEVTAEFFNVSRAAQSEYLVAAGAIEGGGLYDGYLHGRLLPALTASTDPQPVNADYLPRARLFSEEKEPSLAA